MRELGIASWNESILVLVNHIHSRLLRAIDFGQMSFPMQSGCYYNPWYSHGTVSICHPGHMGRVNSSCTSAMIHS